MKRMIIATELLKGQGLGNQLFCYVTTRALAHAGGCDFSILNRELLDCMYFMDIDCGLDIEKDRFENIYYEKEDRIFLGNSKHDIEHGCYITGVDNRMLSLTQTTLLYGNMQDESYFGKYKNEIRDWLRVKPEYDCMDYSRENLCVINIRGGEYTSNPELFLRRRYWLDAMKIMRQKRADMEFMVVTDDLSAARRVLPEVKAYHFDLAGDYTAIKNARYLIVSNSTFAFFPAFTSETVQYIIAPKYWARHNVSDGYWASEQNIYSDFVYLDRKGKLFTASECREELNRYKKKSIYYNKIGQKLEGTALIKAKMRSKWLIYKDLSVRAVRSVKRRMMKQGIGAGSKKLRLPQVTLVAMSSVNIRATIKAMQYSMRGIEFGDAVLITHRRPLGLPRTIRYSHTDKLTDIDVFNYKMVYELGEHIHTDFALIVHADGFVVHPEMWRKEFLDYDYIGAPWPLPPEGDTTTYRDKEGNICRVGNSAGIRSKRLMDFPRKAGIPWEGEYAYGRMWYYEDGFICCKIRHLLEAEGMRIAPLEVAKYYSHEKMIPEVQGITPFAFHKWEGTNAQYPNFIREPLKKRIKGLLRKRYRKV